MKSIYTYHKELLLILLSFIFFVTSLSYAQTTTTVDGSNGIWSTAANWSNGVPIGGGSIVTVNKALQLNANLSFGSGTGGTYSINSPVTDLTGGSAYGITVSNSGTLHVNSNLTIEGSISLTNSGTLIIESGDTLTVGGASFSQTTTINIKAGAVMIVNGNVNVSNASGIACDGELIINGNYVSSNSSSIDGSGSMTTTGTITSNGTSLIFESNADCTTGPCSGRNLCAANANKIATNQSVCSGIQPAQLTDVSNPGGTCTIQWQSSITSGTGGFSNITNANGLNYQPTTLSQNTWYRRVITKGTCVANSPSLQILVGTPIITSQPVDYSICGNSGTAKFSVAASGGTQLTYQWQLNGSNIYNNSTYSGATTSSLTVTATSALNGNTYRCIVSNAGCSATSTSNSARLIISSTAPASPSVSAGTGATCFQITANWTASSNASSYYLDVATDNGFTSMVSGFNSKNVGNVTTCTISGLSLATIYYYRVRAYNNCGTSANSSVISYATSSSICSLTWVGGTSTDWATAANWSGNVVPVAGVDVSIPSGTLNLPINSGSANLRNLIIQSGASLKNNIGGSLSLSGNFTNNGTYTDTGTVVLNGNSNQVITGVYTFNNLNLNNATGAKLNNSITINGILTLSQGALNPNGNLITINLNSGAIAGSGTGSITEPIKVVKLSSNKWHHIGNPLGTNIPISQVTDNITVVKGVLYKYDETNPSTVMEDGWVEIPPATFSSTQMVPMIGYDIFVHQQTTFDVIGMYNHNFSGSVSLTNTSSGQPLSDGWNFLSNPYPSTIDWDASTGWGKSGINNAIYVHDSSNDRYMSYINGNGTNGGSRYISSMQGYWVKCNSGSGSISINNNARVTSPIMKLYKGQAASEVIKLKVSSNGYSDETILKLNSEATSDFDQTFDAYKLKNSGKNPNISSKLNGIEYSINTISDNTTDEIIPIKITTAFVSQYTLSIDLDKFQSDKEVTLIDKKSNVSQDLKLNPNYTFENNNLDTNRFYIRLKNKVSVATGLESKFDNNVFIGSDGSAVTIKLNTDLTTANLSVINMLGNEVYTKDKVSVTGGIISEQIDVHTSGTYIVKLMIGDKIFTGRVFIK